MSDTDLVRASRDGDQFHYWWAARRCLSLVGQQADLRVVSIEGASIYEKKNKYGVRSVTDEIIDLAEYFGGESFEKARRIEYFQLKHSTVRTEQNWTASALGSTIAKFYAKYVEVADSIGEAQARRKLFFHFVSNRPISSEVHALVGANDKLAKIREKRAFKTWLSQVGVSERKLFNFLKQLKISGSQENFIGQRDALSSELTNFLADRDGDAPLQIKELVSRKATSEFKDNGITREDVLRAMHVELDELFPCPNQIEKLESPIKRAQQKEIEDRIADSTAAPIIIHGIGGLGKSILARNLITQLPKNSVGVLYDCFGNGSYRNVSQLRHRHKDGLVQIANELAANQLCFPIIPTPTADPKSYMRAFLSRLTNASQSIRSKNGQIWIVIDAADNAQQAAEEEKLGDSFARDLVKEELPSNVRLVLLCRSHRVELLSPPSNCGMIELEPFDLNESGNKLRQVFPSANDRDVEEFHRLSSMNPRVQATALDQGLGLSETLAALGPEPTGVEDQIKSLLDQSLAALRDKVHSPEDEQIDLICSAIATLRPMIPMSILAKISALPAAAIASFVSDFGAPLLVREDSIQFKDEPTETWFRERFKPSAELQVSFSNRLRRIASDSAYAAAALPQIMFDAGQLSGLVDLTLRSEALPHDSPIDRRDIELKRYEFALRASLRERQLPEAAKLAFKAAIETAAENRQTRIIQNNTDLVACFVEPHQAQDMVSRKVFGGSWLGAHHVYDASLLSCWKDFAGDARSHIRMADAWIRNWSRLSKEDRKVQRIEDQDIAEQIFAHLNVHGVDVAASELRRWIPRQVSYRVGKILASRLIDHCRFEELDQLSSSSGNDIGLLLAINQELVAIGRCMAAKPLSRMIKLLCSPRVNLSDENNFDAEPQILDVITSSIVSALRLDLASKRQLADLLERYLPEIPPRGITVEHNGMRNSLMRAYTLRAALLGKTMELDELRYDELRERAETKERQVDRRSVDEFEFEIGSLLPWHMLWSQIVVRSVEKTDLPSLIGDAADQSNRRIDRVYREWSRVPAAIGEIWFDCIRDSGVDFRTEFQKLSDWTAKTKQSLYTPELARRARIAARTDGLDAYAIEFAQQGLNLLEPEKLEAESKSEEYTAFSRALISASPDEAKAYFELAITISSNIGEDNVDRWETLVSIGKRAKRLEKPNPELAYKFSQCAELTYGYIARDKHFGWEDTVEALSGICPSSSLAILSRWRDRRFGYEPRLFQKSISELHKHGLISEQELSCLVGFRFLWNGENNRNHVDISEAVISSKLGPQLKKTIVSTVSRYALLAGLSAKNLAKIDSLHAEAGLGHLVSQPQASKQQKIDQQKRAGYTSPDLGRNKQSDQSALWDKIFEGLDLSKSENIAHAYQMARDTDGLFGFTEAFFREATTRIDVGKEASFLRALPAVPAFELYEIRALLEVYPCEWKTRLSIKIAIKETVKQYVERHCVEISANRYYQKLPLTLISEVTGLEYDAVIDIALLAIGSSEYLGGYGRLFNIAVLVTERLSPEEAQDVLEFCYTTYEQLGVEEEGDGRWKPTLAPVDDVRTSLAGYIWSGLASPQSTIRWEAAHTVRLAAKFQCHELLANIIKIDEERSWHPYVDLSLFVYELHARQWLLIALYRSALETPDAVGLHQEYIAKQAHPKQMHVAIRHFAAMALLATGVEDKAESERLSNLNRSPYDVMEPPEDRKHGDHYRPFDDKQFSFGIDMPKYWFEPLASCFNKSSIEVEEHAERIIRDDWGLAENGYWNTDERGKRGYFRDMEAHHSHGSYPKVDTVSFYLSYHSMMEVAGRWLRDFPLVKGRYSDSENDPFPGWLERHLLTFRNGQWLMDRRDPTPIEWIDFDDEQRTWQFSVSKENLLSSLSLEDGWIVLNGNWTNYFGDREERVHISSAIISPSNAKSFVRAAQTASDRFGIVMPNSYSDGVIKHGQFELSGIFDHSEESYGIDEQDPWAAEISGHPKKIKQRLLEKLMIQPDNHSKTWFRIDDPEQSAIVRESIWGTFKDDDKEGYVDRGKRLEIRKRSLLQLERKIDRKIVFQVSIERNYRGGRYSAYRNQSKGLEYLDPYTLYCVMNDDGTYDGYR